MVRVIGIHLGISNSCVGSYRNGSVEIIANMQGYRTTPSIVSFTDKGVVVGQAALRQKFFNFGNTIAISDAISLIGRRFEDIKPDDMKQWPFKVILNENGRPYFLVSNLLEGKKEIYSPDEIIALILVKMKKIAEDHLSDEVTSAVITVPAYFIDSQLEATRNAAKIANLEVLQLINEPAAAAIAYGLNEKIGCDQNILVFDLGSSTFDVTVLKSDFCEVKAVGGDTNMCGKDFNNKICDHFIEEFEQRHGFDISTDKIAISKLSHKCEKVKIALSTSEIASVQVDGLFKGLNFSSGITRARFEDLNADFFKRMMRIVDKTISDSQLDKADIHEVVLVGGSTKIPKIQSLLEDYFVGKKLNKSIEHSEVVAYGAVMLTSLFVVGISQFYAGDYEAAFENFTLALRRNSKNVEAMNIRALIHFDRDEIDCCLIECEEILKFRNSSFVTKLEEDAKKRIRPKQPWFKVYGVKEYSSRKLIEERYRKLAKQYSSQSKDNYEKLAVDKRKLDRKLVLLNEAKASYIATLP